MGENSAYLPLDRARETADWRNNTSSSGGYTPMSRWAAESIREQPWNAVREVFASPGDYLRREHTSSAGRSEWNSVEAIWGSERGRR